MGRWSWAWAWWAFALTFVYTVAQCGRRIRTRNKIEIARCSLVLFSFAFLFLCIVFAHFLSSTSHPTPLSTHCKILSLSIDIRYSKVCELGLFNYDADTLLPPSHATRFSCKLDYYWASVLQVEYRQFASNNSVKAAAEIPNEALPLVCRPDFSFVRRMTNALKVNETYLCQYTPGKSMADIIVDNFFTCSTTRPSMIEILRRLAVLVSGPSLILSEKTSVLGLVSKSIASLFAGMFFPFVVTTFVRALNSLKYMDNEALNSRDFSLKTFKSRMQVSCFITACVIAFVWTGFQYYEFSHLMRRVFLDSPIPKIMMSTVLRCFGFG